MPWCTPLTISTQHWVGPRKGVSNRVPQLLTPALGPRLREWRTALRFEEKLAGRKERNSIAIERLICCSNRPNFFCTPNAIFYSRVIFKFSVCLFATQKSTFANYEHGVQARNLRGRRRGEAPLENFSPPLEKCVGYILKILDIVQNIWAPLQACRQDLAAGGPKTRRGATF